MRAPIVISIRASMEPRQKWRPAPKAKWLVACSARNILKVSGSLNRAGIVAAAVALAEARLARTEIRAPFSGIVGLRRDVGGLVSGEGP